ncbi:MAG: hypothetical protein FWE22_05635 [Firmicutes bacterium]|nr:hypothetical protein [Bacillota bacterium]
MKFFKSTSNITLTARQVLLMTISIILLVGYIFLQFLMPQLQAPINATAENNFKIENYGLNIASFVRSTNLEALSASNEHAVGEQGPYTRYEGDVYTDCNRRIVGVFHEGFSLILTEGEGDESVGIVAVGGCTTPLFYIEETNEVIDGAGSSLQFYFDSLNMQHTLRLGNRPVRSRGISPSCEVFLVNIRWNNNANDVRPVYAFREQFYYGANLLNPLSWFRRSDRYRYKYFDMMNREIPIEWVVTRQEQLGISRGARLALAFLTKGISETIMDSFLDLGGAFIREQWTLSDLRVYLRSEHQHFWARLVTYDTRQHITTFDGEYLFIHPYTNQLTNFWGFPIFDSRSGFPVFIYEGQIVTFARGSRRDEIYLVEQPLVDSILLFSATEDFFFEHFGEVYIGILDSPVGRLNILVINSGTDENPIWRCALGNDISDMLLPMHISDGWGRESGNSLRYFLEDLLNFSGLSGFGGFLDGFIRVVIIIGIILGVAFVGYIIYSVVVSLKKKKEEG